MSVMQREHDGKRLGRSWTALAAGSACVAFLSASAHASRMDSHHSSHTNQDELFFVTPAVPVLHTNQDRWRPIPPKEDDEDDDEDKKDRRGDRMIGGEQRPAPEHGGLPTLLFEIPQKEGPLTDHLQLVPGADAFEIWLAGDIGSDAQFSSSAHAWEMYSIPGPGVLLPLVLAGALGRSRRRR